MGVLEWAVKGIFGGGEYSLGGSSLIQSTEAAFCSSSLISSATHTLCLSVYATHTPHAAA